MIFPYLWNMFIREVKKQRSKDAKAFYQYNLVQTSRIEGKVKQSVILYLGSDPLLTEKENQKIILNILKARIFRQDALFPEGAPQPLQKLGEAFYEKYLIKYGEPVTDQVSIPPAPDRAEMHQVDIKGLEVSDVKSFGAEHLCKQVTEKLKLRECLERVGIQGKQADKALIAIVARAIFSSSEH